MKILISTANYNSENDSYFFLESLNKLALANKDYNFHVQLFDNSNTISTLGVYDNINYALISPDKNIGLAPTWKISIEYFNKNDFDVLILINNDTQFAEDFFSKLRQALDKEPYAIFSPYITLENGEPWSTGGHFGIFPWVIKHEAKPLNAYNEELILTGHLSGCCLIVPKIVFEKHINIFTGLSDFFFRGEEWFLNKRFKENNIKQFIIRDAVLIHRENGSHQRFSAAHIYWAIRAKMLYIKKLRRSEWVISIITYIPYVLTKGLIFYKKNSSLSYIKVAKIILHALMDGIRKKVIRASHY